MELDQNFTCTHYNDGEQYKIDTSYLILRIEHDGIYIDIKNDIDKKSLRGWNVQKHGYLSVKFSDVGVIKSIRNLVDGFLERDSTDTAYKSYFDVTEGMYETSDGESSEVESLQIRVDDNCLFFTSLNIDAGEVWIPSSTIRKKGNPDNSQNLVDLADLLKQSLQLYRKNEYPSLDGRKIDDELLEKCLPLYNEERYQSAIQQAFIILEERIRQQANIEDQSIVGKGLADEAFDPESGPLSFGGTSAEEHGLKLLYMGAFMAIRNPKHHRFVDLDERETYDLICFVDLLLHWTEQN